jgi:hypothetical protein
MELQVPEPGQPLAVRVAGQLEQPPPVGRGRLEFQPALKVAQQQAPPGQHPVQRVLGMLPGGQRQAAQQGPQQEGLIPQVVGQEQVEVLIPQVPEQEQVEVLVRVQLQERKPGIGVLSAFEALLWRFVPGD